MYKMNFSFATLSNTACIPRDRAAIELFETGCAFQGFSLQKNAMEGFAMSTVITSPEDKHIAESVGGGSAAEIIGGIAAIVL
ncbi:MAG: hypothetical protein P8141_03170, partial [Gammaproteobacteria bacterium]